MLVLETLCDHIRFEAVQLHRKDKNLTPHEVAEKVWKTITLDGLHPKFYLQLGVQILEAIFKKDIPYLKITVDNKKYYISKSSDTKTRLTKNQILKKIKGGVRLPLIDYFINCYGDGFLLFSQADLECSQNIARIECVRKWKIYETISFPYTRRRKFELRNTARLIAHLNGLTDTDLYWYIQAEDRKAQVHYG